jgi:uncharacterized protein GlcG (DUF336 family)
MDSTRTIPALTSQAARTMVDAAIAAAERTAVRFAVAVVDGGGHLVAFTRMDDAPVMSIGIAIDKAYTAAGFGMSTQQWGEFIKNDPPLAAGVPSQIDRVVTFGGGIPVTADGHVIGGIGVCGGHWTDDVAIAEAGLAAMR